MRSRAFKQPDSHGFTLLEVLVAMAVIAIAMAAIIKTTGAGASNSAYLRDKTLAHWVAMNRFARMQLDEAPPDTGRDEGKMEMAGREWFWFTEIKETPDESVHRVELSVHLENKRDSPSIAVLTGFLGTTRSPPATLPPQNPNQTPGRSEDQDLDQFGSDSSGIGQDDGLL